jgi:MoxR-like ATPase
MAIPGLTAEAFERQLAAVIRPSRPVDSFECLIDRSDELDRIEQAIASPGRHVFIYGERGAGKTSLAHTAAYRHESSYAEPAFCACGRQTTFASIIKDATEQLLQRPQATSQEFSRDLNRACDWNLPDEEANTIAGLVIHEAQAIPNEGQVFSFHGFRFEVLGRDGNRLTRLRIRRLG